MSILLSRREQSRMKRRAAMLAIARRIFLTHGYASASMSAIAAEIGGSKGTLWAHFASKESLFEAVLDELTADFRADMQDALRPGRDVQTTLTAFCERFIIKLFAPLSIALHRLVVSEAGRTPEVGKIFYDRGPRQVISALTDYLTAQMAAGLLREDDPLRAARQLVGLAQAPFQWQRFCNVGETVSAATMREEAERAAETFLRAYAPGPRND